ICHSPLYSWFYALVLSFVRFYYVACLQVFLIMILLLLAFLLFLLLVMLIYYPFYSRIEFNKFMYKITFESLARKGVVESEILLFMEGRKKQSLLFVILIFIKHTQNERYCSYI